jgi:hypothetical protein
VSFEPSSCRRASGNDHGRVHQDRSESRDALRCGNRAQEFRFAPAAGSKPTKEIRKSPDATLCRRTFQLEDTFRTESDFHTDQVIGMSSNGSAPLIMTVQDVAVLGGDGTLAQVSNVLCGPRT